MVENNVLLLISLLPFVIMPQLDSSSFLSQVIWLAISFCILYCIVNYYFLPRLEVVIDSRKYMISRDLKEAKVLMRQAQELQAEIYKMLEEANNSASAIRVEADQRVKVLVAERTKQIEAEASEYMYKERNRILSIQGQYMKDVKNQAEILKKQILRLLS